MTNAVIVDAVRTPLGKRNGSLKDWHPVDLAAHTLQALVEHHRSTAASLSLLTTIVDEPTGYGRIVRQPDGTLRGIVEERDLALFENEWALRWPSCITFPISRSWATAKRMR